MPTNPFEPPKEGVTPNAPCPNRRYEPLEAREWSIAEVLQLLHQDSHALWSNLASVMYSPTLSGEFKFQLVQKLLPLGDMSWRGWVWSAAGFHVREDSDCYTAQFYELALATLLGMDNEAENTEEAGGLTDTLSDLIKFTDPADQAWSWYRGGAAWQRTIALDYLNGREGVETVLDMAAAEVTGLDPICRATAAAGLSDLVTRGDVNASDLEPYLGRYVSLLATYEADNHWYVRYAARIARDLYESFIEEEGQVDG